MCKVIRNATLCLIAMLLAPALAPAADRGYTQGAGNWTTGANWTDGANPGVPATGDRVFIGGGFVPGMANQSAVIVDTDLSGAAISEAFVALLGDGSTLGVIDIVSNGTLSTSGRIHLGAQAGGTGTVTVTGGTLQEGDVYIGESGAGRLTIGGGATVSGGTLYVGGGGPGSVTMSSGTLNLGGNAIIVPSAGGGGTVTLDGGSVTCGSLGFGHGGVGAGWMAGADTLVNAGRLYLGVSGLGTLVKTNGTLLVSGNFEIGIGADATFTQYAGTTTCVRCGINFGGGGNCTLNMHGGSFSVATDFYLGNGGVGTLNLTAGAIAVAGQIWSVSTDATINHSGGTFTGQSEFRLGNGGSGNATYNLSGTGVLDVQQNWALINVASAGTSTFNQQGGVARFQRLDAGYTGGSQVGIYRLSGGELHATELNRNDGVGSDFIFTGGALSADVVNFNLVNGGGMLSPGRTNSIGKTRVNGSYTVTGGAAGLAIQIGGTESGVTHDWLDCSGAANLGGTLSVTLAPDYVPAASNAFTVVTGIPVTGTFANAAVSGTRYNLGEASFVVTYSSSAVVLQDYAPARPPSGFIIHVR